MMNNERGYTLVELIITMALTGFFISLVVVSILVVMALCKYSGV